MSQKRSREAPAIDTQLIEIYEDLANIDEEIRLKATHDLLMKASPESGLTAEQLREILRRLMRGLCSGRKGARLGFSIALTELQSQVFRANAYHASPMSLADFVQSLKKETEVVGNISGQEKRDHHFGRLFGAQTIIKSGILFDAHVDPSLWPEVVDLIVGLATRKSWLREQCGWVLYQAIQGSRASNLSSEHVQIVVDKFSENGLTGTPEGVAIWIAILERHPAVKFPNGFWKHENPLHRKETARLAEVLREASSSHHDEGGAESKKSQKGTWAAQLHFAWEVILDRLLKGPLLNGKPSKKSKDELSFPDFWKECVDKSLFADSSSNERKYWGFLLFQHMIQHAPHFPVEVSFSQNLMRCFMNQLSSPERYLHLAAEQAVDILLERVRSETSMAVPSLNGLMTPPNGEVNFDLITNTRTVEKLVNMVTNACLDDLLQIFRRLVINPGVRDEKGAASRRQVIGNLLLSTTRSRSVLTGGDKPVPSEAEQSILQVLSLLVELAYFTRNSQSNPPGSEDDPPMSPASHDMFQARILSCLTDLTTKSTNPSTFAYHVVKVIFSRQEQSASFTPLLAMDNAILEVMRKARRLLEKIHLKEQSSTVEKKPLLTAFKLLSSLVIIEVYNGDTDAVNMVDELKDSYSKLLGREKSRSQEGSEAIIEIILSLLAKPARLFRRIGPHVYSTLAKDINESALQSIIQVLLTEENVVGQGEIFDDVDEVEGSMSDVEQIDASELSGGDPSTHGDESSIKGMDLTSKNEEDDDELAAFDAKLAQALGTRSSMKVGGAAFDEASEEDMDDEQMEAFDGQLTKIFVERNLAASQKNQRNDPKERIIKFKDRVLEMLGTFIQKQHTNPLWLKLLIPLLVAVRTTKSKLVREKAHDLLTKYKQLCKGKNVPKVDDQEATFDLLAAVHDEATRHGSLDYVSACSQASLLIVKVLIAHNREYIRRIGLQYATTEERWSCESNSKRKKKSTFFTDWETWCTSAKSTWHEWGLGDQKGFEELKGFGPV